MSERQDTRLVRICNGTRPYYGVYRCNCGTVKEIYDYSVKNGSSLSCGCYRDERTSERNRTQLWGTTHGLSGTREYSIWTGIVSRCDPQHAAKNPNYAGRGIRVCDRWTGRSGFANFIADMGVAPSNKHTVDRIDNDGNYEPGNCRWATRKEQLRNTRRNERITFRGRTLCLMDWSVELGINYRTLSNRIDRGWNIERAFTEPVRHRVRK